MSAIRYSLPQLTRGVTTFDNLIFRAAYGGAVMAAMESIPELDS